MQRLRRLRETLPDGHPHQRLHHEKLARPFNRMFPLPDLLTVCAQDALKLSFGCDLGGKELLREREPKLVAESAVATNKVHRTVALFWIN